jgi:hypothetical protein
MKASPLLLALLPLLAGCASHRPVEVVEIEPTPYTYPFVSPGAKFAALPPPVQLAIRAQSGTAELRDIARFTSGGQPVYKVWFVKDDIYPPLYLASDGSVLNPDLSVAVGASSDSFSVVTGSGASDLRLQDLMPPAVLKALQQRAPISEVAHLSKQPWGQGTLYGISFKNPHLYPQLYITSDGTVIEQPPK